MKNKNFEKFEITRRLLYVEKPSSDRAKTESAKAKEMAKEKKDVAEKKEAPKKSIVTDDDVKQEIARISAKIDRSPVGEKYKQAMRAELEKFSQERIAKLKAIDKEADDKLKQFKTSLRSDVDSFAEDNPRVREIIDVVEPLLKNKAKINELTDLRSLRPDGPVYEAFLKEFSSLVDVEVLKKVMGISEPGLGVQTLNSLGTLLDGLGPKTEVKADTLTFRRGEEVSEEEKYAIEHKMLISDVIKEDVGEEELFAEDMEGLLKKYGFKKQDLDLIQKKLAGQEVDIQVTELRLEDEFISITDKLPASAEDQDVFKSLQRLYLLGVVFDDEGRREQAMEMLEGYIDKNSDRLFAGAFLSLSEREAALKEEESALRLEEKDLADSVELKEKRIIEMVKKNLGISEEVIFSITDIEAEDEYIDAELKDLEEMKGKHFAAWEKLKASETDLRQLYLEKDFIKHEQMTALGLRSLTLDKQILEIYIQRPDEMSEAWSRANESGDMELKRLIERRELAIADAQDRMRARAEAGEISSFEGKYYLEKHSEALSEAVDKYSQNSLLLDMTKQFEDRKALEAIVEERESRGEEADVEEISDEELGDLSPVEKVQTAKNHLRPLLKKASSYREALYKHYSGRIPDDDPSFKEALDILNRVEGDGFTRLLTDRGKEMELVKDVDADLKRVATLMRGLERDYARMVGAEKQPPEKLKKLAEKNGYTPVLIRNAGAYEGVNEEKIENNGEKNAHWLLAKRGDDGVLRFISPVALGIALDEDKPKKLKKKERERSWEEVMLEAYDQPATLLGAKYEFAGGEKKEVDPQLKHEQEWSEQAAILRGLSGRKEEFYVTDRETELRTLAAEAPASEDLNEMREKRMESKAELVKAIQTNPNLRRLREASVPMAKGMGKIHNMLQEVAKGNKTQAFVDSIKSEALLLARSDKLDEVRAAMSAAKTDMDKLRDFSSGNVDDEFETFINQTVRQLNQVEGACNQVESFVKSVSSVYADNFEEWAKRDGLVMAGSVLGAVLMMTGIGAPEGSFIIGLAVTSAVASAGGIVGGEIAKFASDEIFDTGLKSAFEIYMENPTREAFHNMMMNYGQQWGMSTAQMFVFMGLGKMVGSAMAQFGEKGVFFLGNLAKHIQKVMKGVKLEFLHPTTAVGKIAHETIQEFIEEFLQSGLEQIDPVLGFVGNVLLATSGGDIKTNVKTEISGETVFDGANGEKVVSHELLYDQKDFDALLAEQKKEFGDNAVKLDEDGNIVVEFTAAIEGTSKAFHRRRVFKARESVAVSKQESRLDPSFADLNEAMKSPTLTAKFDKALLDVVSDINKLQRIFQIDKAREVAKKWENLSAEIKGEYKKISSYVDSIISSWDLDIGLSETIDQPSDDVALSETVDLAKSNENEIRTDKILVKRSGTGEIPRVKAAGVKEAREQLFRLKFRELNDALESRFMELKQREENGEITKLERLEKEISLINQKIDRTKYIVEDAYKPVRSMTFQDREEIYYQKTESARKMISERLRDIKRLKSLDQPMTSRKAENYLLLETQLRAEDRPKYKELWPKGMEFSTGDSSFDAALNLVKNSVDGPKLLLGMIEKSAEGWKVEFPGSDYTVEVSADKLKERKGQMGDLILETAFSEYKKYESFGDMDPGEIALKLLRQDYILNYSPVKGEEKILETDELETRMEMLLNNKEKLSDEELLLRARTAVDVGEEGFLKPNHNYVVVSADRRRDIVEVADSSNMEDRVEMNYVQFMEYFVEAEGIMINDRAIRLSEKTVSPDLSGDIISEEMLPDFSKTVKTDRFYPVETLDVAPGEKVPAYAGRVEMRERPMAQMEDAEGAVDLGGLKIQKALDDYRKEFAKIRDESETADEFLRRTADILSNVEILSQTKTYTKTEAGQAQKKADDRLYNSLHQKFSKEKNFKDWYAYDYANLLTELYDVVFEMSEEVGKLPEVEETVVEEQAEVLEGPAKEDLISKYVGAKVREIMDQTGGPDFSSDETLLDHLLEKTLEGEDFEYQLTGGEAMDPVMGNTVEAMEQLDSENLLVSEHYQNAIRAHLKKYKRGDYLRKYRDALKITIEKLHEKNLEFLNAPEKEKYLIKPEREAIIEAFKYDNFPERHQHMINDPALNERILKDALLRISVRTQNDGSKTAQNMLNEWPDSLQAKLVSRLGPEVDATKLKFVNTQKTILDMMYGTDSLFVVLDGEYKDMIIPFDLTTRSKKLTDKESDKASGTRTLVSGDKVLAFYSRNSENLVRADEAKDRGKMKESVQKELDILADSFVVDALALLKRDKARRNWNARPGISEELFGVEAEKVEGRPMAQLEVKAGSEMAVETEGFSIKDYSERAVFQQAVAELKTRLKAGEINKEVYSSLVKGLHRQRYLDLMGHVMTKAEEWLSDPKNADKSADEIYDHLADVYSPSKRLSLSSVQQKILRKAVEKFVADRKIIKRRAGDLSTKVERRLLLQSLGIPDSVSLRDVKFDTSNPVAIGIIFKNKKDYVDFFMYGDTDPHERMRAENSKAFFTPGYHFPDAELQGKVFAVNGFDYKSSAVTHELQHLMFSNYFDSMLYAMKAEGDEAVAIQDNDDYSPAEKVRMLKEGPASSMSEEYISSRLDDYLFLKEKKRYIMDETLAYLREGKFRIGEISLLGINIDKAHINSVDNRVRLQRVYDQLTFEIERLRKEGYKPLDVYNKVKTAENIEDFVSALQSIGTSTDFDRAELDLLLESFDEQDRLVLEEEGYLYDFDPWSDLPVSHGERMQRLKELKTYRESTMNLIDGIVEKADLDDPAAFIDLFDRFLVDLETGEIIDDGMEVRIAKNILKLNHFASIFEKVDPNYAKVLRQNIPRAFKDVDNYRGYDEYLAEYTLDVAKKAISLKYIEGMNHEYAVELWKKVYGHPDAVDILLTHRKLFSIENLLAGLRQNGAADLAEALSEKYKFSEIRENADSHKEEMRKFEEDLEWHADDYFETYKSYSEYIDYSPYESLVKKLELRDVDEEVVKLAEESSEAVPLRTERPMASMEEVQGLRDILYESAPMSKAEKVKYLKPEILSELSTEEYIALWGRLNPYYISHVTRQGFRDHAEGPHTAWRFQFNDGFKAIAKDQKQLRPVMSAEFGLMGVDEKSVANYLNTYRGDVGYEDLVDGFILKADTEEEAKERFYNSIYRSKGSAAAYPDRTSVHFANEIVSDDFYGAEKGNEVFFLYPSDVIASQYDYAFSGWEKDFTKAQSDPTWNDVFIWPSTLDNPGISLDEGLVFLPEKTMVDPKTGSKYASEVKVVDGKEKRVLVKDEALNSSFVNWATGLSRDSAVYKAYEEYANDRDYGERRKELYKEYQKVFKEKMMELGFSEEVSIDIVNYFRHNASLESLINLNEGGYDIFTPKERAEQILEYSNAGWKMAENPISAKEYWEGYFREHPEQKPKHLVFYDGDPTSFVADFQKKHGIGKGDVSESEGVLLGFEDRHVRNMGEDPRTNRGKEELMRIGNKLIEEHYRGKADKEDTVYAESLEDLGVGVGVAPMAVEADLEADIDTAKMNQGFWNDLRGAVDSFVAQAMPKNRDLRTQQMEMNIGVEGLSNKERAMLAHLFPEGIEVSHFRQSNTGNCYYLAALHSIKRHPIAPYIFAKAISPVRGGWEVKFPGEKPVFVPTNELDGKEEWDAQRKEKVFKHTLQGQLGDKIMVLAHAKWRKMKNNFGGDMRAGRTLMQSEGGWGKEALDLLLRAYSSETFDIGYPYGLLNSANDRKGMAMALLERFADEPRNFILTVATPVFMETDYKGESGKEFRGEKYYMDSEKRFVQQHMYSVVSVDAKNELVTVVNPHDTRSKEHVISYDEFLSYFAVINAVKLDPNRIEGAEFIKTPTVKGELGARLQPTLASTFEIGSGLTLNIGKKTGIPCRLNSDNSVLLDMQKVPGVSNIRLAAGEEIILGRNNYENLPVTVSGTHARIKNMGNGQLLVTDLNSRNGTVVDKAKLEMPEPAAPGLLGVKLAPDLASRYNATNNLSIYLGKSVEIPCMVLPNDQLYLQLSDSQARVLKVGEKVVLGGENMDFLPMTVSANHAEITYIGNGEFLLKDLNSTNGTRVDYPGRVADPDQYVLKDGRYVPKDSVEKVEKLEADSNILDGAAYESLAEGMKSYIAPDGTEIVASTFKGVNYKAHNEDRIFVDAESGVMAVIDGMGGMGSGDKAAQILAEEIKKLPKDIKTAVKNASEKMAMKLGPSPGAVFAAVDLEAGLVYHSGDAKCVIFDKNGRIKFETKDQSIVQSMVDYRKITEDEALYHPQRNVVMGGVSARHSEIETAQISGGLDEGDRVMFYSDGVGDNITPKELWALTRGQSPEEAMRTVSDVVAYQMTNKDKIIADTGDRSKKLWYEGKYRLRSRPKSDNVAFGIADIKVKAEKPRIKKRVIGERLDSNKNYPYVIPGDSTLRLLLGKQSFLDVKGKGKDIEIYKDGASAMTLAPGEKTTIGRAMPFWDGMNFAASVSGEHVRLYNNNGVLEVTDLNSTNGTTVNYLN